MNALDMLLDPANVNSAAQPQGKPPVGQREVLPVPPALLQRPQGFLPTEPTTAQLPQVVQPPVDQPPADEAVNSWKQRISEITQDKALMGAGLMVLAGALKRPELGQNDYTLFAEGLENGVKFYQSQKKQEADLAAQNETTRQGAEQVSIAQEKLRMEKEGFPVELEGKKADTAYKKAVAAEMPDRLELDKDKNRIAREELAQRAKELDAKIKEAATEAQKAGKLTEAGVKEKLVQSLMSEEGLSEEQAWLRVGGLDETSRINNVIEKMAGSGAFPEDLLDTKQALIDMNVTDVERRKIERTEKELRTSGLLVQQPNKAGQVTNAFPQLPPDEEEKLLTLRETEPSKYAQELTKLAGREKTLKGLLGAEQQKGNITLGKDGQLTSKVYNAQTMEALNRYAQTDRAKLQMALELLAKKQSNK